MNILAIDVSGNFKEGKGTSGFCYMIDGKPQELFELKAKEYHSAESYWEAHIRFIKSKNIDHIVMEGYRLYNHKGMSASAQANSELETPQLIGAIKLWCYMDVTPLAIQFAPEVKQRWKENVLVAKKILEERPGGRYYFNGKATNDHKRDALKHALHFWRYGDYLTNRRIVK